MRGLASQVSKEDFVSALKELGHDPAFYEGKKLSLDAMSQLYEIDENIILDAIDRRKVNAHYDYGTDTIWVDALEAAHFYYCSCNEMSLFPRIS
jgi:hypothetical protein